MKMVRINKGKVGLVFRNGDYRYTLSSGLHWLSPFEVVRQYDVTKPFHPPVAIHLLLEDEMLADMLHVVEVRDYEVAVKYEFGNLQDVLAPGQYYFWKMATHIAVEKFDTRALFIPEAMSLAVKKHVGMQAYISIFWVEPYEKGLLYVNGALDRMLDPGDYFFWKNDQNKTLLKTDMRQREMEVTGQEILTGDKAAIRVNFILKYQVVDILKAKSENEDYIKQMYHMAQLQLRALLGGYTLDEILDKKSSLAISIKEALDQNSSTLGVHVLDCGIRDIILPGDVKDIMNQVLVAQKQAQANVIMRREETASTRSLLNTAKLMEDNAMLWKLKEMEYVEKIADRIGEITLSGNDKILHQLKGIFSSEN